MNLSTCQSDYWEIYDRHWHKSPLLGRFCGINKYQLSTECSLNMSPLIQSAGFFLLVIKPLPQCYSKQRMNLAQYKSNRIGILIISFNFIEVGAYRKSKLKERYCSFVASSFEINCKSNIQSICTKWMESVKEMSVHRSVIAANRIALTMSKGVMYTDVSVAMCCRYGITASEGVIKNPNFRQNLYLL